MCWYPQATHTRALNALESIVSSNLGIRIARPPTGTIRPPTDITVCSAAQLCRALHCPHICEQPNSSRGWVVCTRWVVRGTPDDTADSNEFRSHCVPSLSTVMAKHTGYHKHWNTCCCPCLSNSKDGVFSMCGLDTVCVARCLMVVRMESNSSVYSLMNHSELCVVIGATGLWWWSAIACVATGLWWWAGAQRGMESQRVCPTSTCCISSCC